MIEILDITKKYDSFTLGPVNLSVPKGEIVGLIGENGAGKTTLLKTILGIINPSQGTVAISGKDFKYCDTSEIGVVLDNMFFPEILTPKDINSIMKDIYKTWDEELYASYMKVFNIPTDKQLKTLSKGTRKKVEIATALSHRPKLLILDEPTTGLDPVVRSEILDIFLEFIEDEEHTILLSTHITSDLEHIADRIVFIDDGKVLLNEPKDELLDNYGILKCAEKEFDSIDKSDIISYKKYRYNYDILIKDKIALEKKYKKLCIDKITLEELMLLMIKGEKL